MVGPAGQVIAIEPNPALRDAIGEVTGVDGVADPVRPRVAPAVICETDPGGEVDVSLQNGGYGRATVELRRGAFGNYLARNSATPC